MRSVFPPGARLGLRYRIGRVVAHGPLAALYEAHDLASGERVAFKWLCAPAGEHEALGRLAQRARSARSLREPGLLDVLEVEREEDSLFVVSSWEAGLPYSHLLAEGSLPRSQRLAALAVALTALQAVHAFGLAHGGLHPDNLLWSARSGVRVKLLDLALNQSMCAALVGTPQHVTAGHHLFLAPEQLARGYEPNARSDVFAAGVLVYQALTGHFPFVAPDIPGLRAQLAQAPPRADQLHSDVPSTLAARVAECLAERPEQRAPTVGPLCAELQAYAPHALATDLGGGYQRPSLSATQVLRRELTPAALSTLESASASQPISFHGELTPRPRWDLWVAAALAASTVVFALVVALLPPGPEQRPTRQPPPLPEVAAVEPRDAGLPTRSAPPAAAPPAAASPAAAPAAAEAPAGKARKARATSVRRREAPAVEPAPHVGLPLSRDDF